MKVQIIKICSECKETHCKLRQACGDIPLDCPLPDHIDLTIFETVSELLGISKQHQSRSYRIPK